MSKKVRHIWAKANQHVKVHRSRRSAGNSDDGDNMHYVIIGVIVVLYLLLK